MRHILYIFCKPGVYKALWLALCLGVPKAHFLKQTICPKQLF